MRREIKSVLVCLGFMVWVSSCGSDEMALLSEGSGEPCYQGDIVEALKNCIPDAFIESVKTTSSGKEITIQYKQLVDQMSQSEESFMQKIVLLHRDVAKPMVLATTGYSLYTTREREITRLFNANQLFIEHRYFDGSTPKDPDYSKLNIQQAAYDFHKITKAFRKIYTGKWVNTGASKGGMTSVYHRRFFPEDVDATVAYVAPLSFDVADQRYNEFIETVGGKSQMNCRTKLIEFQKLLFERKKELEDYIESGTYTRFGGKIGTIELAASEFRFVFWQYANPSQCASIPNSKSSDEKIFSFFNSYASLDQSYSDEGINFFQSYFYQAATELGSPAADRLYIEENIDFPEAFEFSSLLPLDTVAEYTDSAMKDIDTWVQEKSEKIMYIYGEYDPWTAGKFELGASVDRESLMLTAPKGNHGANISKLNSADNEIAVSMLEKWLDATAEKDDSKKSLQLGDDMEIGLRHL